jgi:Clp amino terminal domain, pathogenicity island component
VIALEVADLVVIASRTLGLDTGQVIDLLDPAAAEHALAQARPGSGPGEPAIHAAVLLHALVRQRPLRRGNQEVALAAILQFLALNGWDMDPDPPGPVAAMVTRIAIGTLDVKDVADWLAPRLRPAARTKEAPMRERPALPLAEKIKRATIRTRPKGLFTRFTERARKAVVLALGEARDLGHASIGSEHLLLGLLAEGEGVAAMALESLGISLEEARGQVEEIAGRSQQATPGSIPFTPQATKVLKRSPQEALKLGHLYVGTEHLLLSLLAVGDGVTAQALAGRRASYDLVRERVVALLTGRHGQADPQTRLVRLSVPAGLADVTEQLRQVQRLKTLASKDGDPGSAKALRVWEGLRAREEQLRAEKLRLEHEWAADVDVQAVIAENQRVHRELDRLRDLLRQHGIEPDGGTARTA